jgi:hypothetical protein
MCRRYNVERSQLSIAQMRQREREAWLGTAEALLNSKAYLAGALPLPPATLVKPHHFHSTSALNGGMVCSPS